MLSTADVVILNGAAMISARGEFDRFTAHVLDEAIEEAVAETTGGVCLDMSGVTFVDLSVVRLIVAANLRLRDSGRFVKILSPSRTVERLLAAMQLGDGLYV